MALFRNVGVKLRVSLCDVLSYVSAQTLVFPCLKHGIFDLPCKNVIYELETRSADKTTNGWTLGRRKG